MYGDSQLHWLHSTPNTPPCLGLSVATESDSIRSFLQTFHPSFPLSESIMCCKRSKWEKFISSILVHFNLLSPSFIWDRAWKSEIVVQDLLSAWFSTRIQQLGPMEFIYRTITEVKFLKSGMTLRKSLQSNHKDTSTTANRTIEFWCPEAFLVSKLWLGNVSRRSCSRLSVSIQLEFRNQFEHLRLCKKGGCGNCIELRQMPNTIIASKRFRSLQFYFRKYCTFIFINIVSHLTDNFTWNSNK